MNAPGQHPLDNVVWSALTTTHAGLALGEGLARHYPRDIAPFSAIAEAGGRAYADLARGLAPGEQARLFRPAEEQTAPGWETLSARPIIQMVAHEGRQSDEEPEDLPIEPLGIAEAGEVLALVEITRPGPFAARTVLLGDYVGLRDPNGRLVAMAGTRFRLPGFTEISAICTHPDARGRGYGRLLTRHLMALIARRGETAFLHVYPDNPASALYPGWGFRERARLWVIQRRPISGQ